MQPIETYPVNIPSERSKEGALYQALTKTVGELFPRGLLDGKGKPIPPSDLEWWKITDEVDSTTIIVCPKDAYPDTFTIQRDLEYDSHIIVYSARSIGPFDRMTWKLSRGEASTTLSMIAHRTGRPPQNEELLNVVDRLSPDSGEVVAPGLFNGIFVVCCGCHGEFGKRKSAVYGWNIDSPAEELRRPVRVPVQMKSPREITQGFSPN
jgi:hypothetical protein